METTDFSRDSDEWAPLGDFFSAYLNQDVFDQYGGLWNAAAAYIEESPASDVRATARTARRLASTFVEDEATERAADQLGLAYSPRADGLSCKGWLIELADFLEAGR